MVSTWIWWKVTIKSAVCPKSVAPQLVVCWVPNKGLWRLPQNILFGLIAMFDISSVVYRWQFNEVRFSCGHWMDHGLQLTMNGLQASPSVASHYVVSTSLFCRLKFSLSNLHHWHWQFFLDIPFLDLRPDFFDLLDYVTRRSEKLGFQKKRGGFWGPVVRNVNYRQPLWLLELCNFLDKH